MADLRGAFREFYSLEQLSAGDSALHSIGACAKIIGTLFYIASVISARSELSRLVPFILYPAAAVPLAGIPAAMMLRRCAVALPFCAFAGLSSLFFDRRAAFTLFGLCVTHGLITMLAILFRALLCVSAVMLLIATTPFRDLAQGLRRLHVPVFFITLFEMTWRYAGTLAAEALSMRTAYLLRAGNKKGVDMRDMGSFAGYLLLRSIDRAERVWQAMKCRGYPGAPPASGGPCLRRCDIVFLSVLCGASLIFRAVNVPLFIGRLITCLM